MMLLGLKHLAIIEYFLGGYNVDNYKSHVEELKLLFNNFKIVYRGEYNFDIQNSETGKVIIKVYERISEDFKVSYSLYINGGYNLRFEKDDYLKYLIYRYNLCPPVKHLLKPENKIILISKK